MINFTRIVAVLMGAVIAFGLIVPLALQRHQPLIAIGVALIFLVYAALNVVLWKRLNRRA